MRKSHIPILLLAAMMLSGCGERYVPKPRGYYRIAIPDTAYTPFAGEGYPYRFALSANATVSPRTEKGEQYWIDIVYPAFDARIHCSYKPIQNNLRELSDDAQDFVYKHAGMASAIPEQGYENAHEHVWGVLYELQGNTASPFQFYMTDSTRHFFRGAVYFNCAARQDSLAPVTEYLQKDVRRLMETFAWTR